MSQDTGYNTDVSGSGCEVAVIPTVMVVSSGGLLQGGVDQGSTAAGLCT